MFGLGATELIIIAVILFFLFGAKRLPEIGKGLGGAIREFRKVKVFSLMISNWNGRINNARRSIWRYF